MVSGAILGASLTQKKGFISQPRLWRLPALSACGILVLLAFGSPLARAGMLSHLMLSIYLCRDSLEGAHHLPEPGDLGKATGKRNTALLATRSGVERWGDLASLSHAWPSPGLGWLWPSESWSWPRLAVAKITDGHGPSWQPWPREKAVMAQVSHGEVQVGPCPGWPWPSSRWSLPRSTKDT